MKNIIIFAFIGFLFVPNLWGKTHKEIGSKKVDRWKRLNPSDRATIKKSYDKLKHKYITKFNGNGTRSAYILKIDANSKKSILTWQMKYSEDFVIFVSLETKFGKRYLIYTSGNKIAYMQYGLGDASLSGTWQKYSRNLEKDLHYFDNRNSILKINSFVIRGSGSIAGIRLEKRLNMKSVDKEDEFSKELKEKREVKKRVKSSKKKVLKRKYRAKTDTIPTITIEGDNPLFLERGEVFIEPGVRGEDKEDGEIVVTSSENIDSNKEGKYAVIYMAIDSAGNTAVDKRYVIVGEDDSEEYEEESTKEFSSDYDESRVSKSKDEKSEEEYILEERELEIAEWERELQLREKEISEREKSLMR